MHGDPDDRDLEHLYDDFILLSWQRDIILKRDTSFYEVLVGMYL